MNDRMEDFVKKHRAAFDEAEPNSGLWDRIAADLDSEEPAVEKPKRNYQWMWKAAAVVFICLTAGLLAERSWKQSEEVVAEVQEESTDIEEVENYYSGIIEKRKTEIRLVMERKNVVDEELLSDLDGLDSMYRDLKNELQRNQNNEKVVNAMIRNLQLRVEILNKQLEILDQLVKYEENEEVII